VELEIFQQKQRLAREKAAVAQAALARSQQLLEADEGADSSDSDSDAADEEDVERALGLDTEAARNEGADWGRAMDADDSGRQMLSFDIYLKGNVSRAVSFFKSAGKENQRFRMFPYVEKKRRVDEYGEVLDVAMWVRRGMIMEEEAGDEEAKERKRQEEEAKVRGFVPLLLALLTLVRSLPPVLACIEDTRGSTIKICFHSRRCAARLSPTLH
jgi:cleavage and polyadenylation specificity factor subunit 2